MTADGMAGTTAGHNSKTRLAVFKEIKTGIDNINSKIAELAEERKRFKDRIKADLGMAVKDFNSASHFIDMEDEKRKLLLVAMLEGMTAFGLPWPGDEPAGD